MVRNKFATAAVLTALGAAACIVPDLDLSNESCPCIDGYQCDVSTNRCVPNGIETSDGATNDSQIQDGSALPDGNAGVDAGNDASNETLLFDEEFDGGTLDLTSKWTAVGSGAWTIQSGHGEQTNGNATQAFIYAKNFASATNYHVVTRMHSTGPFDAGHDLAPEMVFRVSPEIDAGGAPQIYQCDVDLQEFEIDLLWILPTGANYLDRQPFTVPASFDVSTPFVLDAVVDANVVTCTVTFDGMSPLTAKATTGGATQLSGSFGLKTYSTAVEYDYFRVFTIP